MTKETEDFLLYKEYTPRGIEALKRGLANLNARQPPPEEESNPRSGVKGVNWCAREKKWVAYNIEAGKCKFCGYWSDVDDAARALDARRAELGE